eukprot:3247832-Lingulodinium_polyedra.AAC.1
MSCGAAAHASGPRALIIARLRTPSGSGISRTGRQLLAAPGPAGRTRWEWSSSRLEVRQAQTGYPT